jgi:LPXTG-motif cell wall-anchored protein
MKAFFTFFSKRNLNTAVLALMVATFLAPELAQAQVQTPQNRQNRQNRCNGSNPPAFCPQPSSTAQAKPENPVGVLLGASVMGGTILLLKRRKRSAEI